MGCGNAQACGHHRLLSSQPRGWTEGGLPDGRGGAEPWEAEKDGPSQWLSASHTAPELGGTREGGRLGLCLSRPSAKVEALSNRNVSSPSSGARS